MMTRAQKELSAALGKLSDSNGGVVAQVESANNRLTQSLEKRENALDALLHQLNTWLLCFWIPLISAAANKKQTPSKNLGTLTKSRGLKRACPSLALIADLTFFMMDVLH